MAQREIRGDIATYYSMHLSAGAVLLTGGVVLYGWPALASVLTPERVTRLHAAGFADPGRAPNYWKNYLVDQADDHMIARELLAILYDVYGYTGLPKLEVFTERTRR